jgi:hypothetical protein
MLPPSVCGVLTVVLAAVVVWCAYSVIRGPGGSTRDRVPVDVEAWHGVMGAAMLPLLRWTPSPDWAWLGCGLFAVMVLWCAVRGSNRRVLGHYWRVGLMAVVMVAMLLPAATASAAAPADPGPAMTGMSGMSGMSGADSSSGMFLPGAASLAVAVIMVLVAGLAVRLAHRAPGVRSRLSATCEAVMASVMALMALAML